MQRHPRIITFLAALCILLSHLGHAADYQIRIEVKDSQKIVADAVYPVPLELVWKVMTNPQSFPKFQSRILSVEFLGLLKGHERYFVKMQTPGWLPNMWNIISSSSLVDQHKMTWKKMEGNLVDHDGFVQIKSGRANTNLHLEMNVQALGLIPLSAVHWSVKSNMTRFLKSLGDHLNTQPLLEPKVLEVPVKR